MSADDDDPRHLHAARAMMHENEQLWIRERHRNENLVRDNDQLRADLADQKELANAAVAEANDSEAECITLRASLATVSAESAERGKALDVWRSENADLKRRIGNLAASHDLPRLQDVGEIHDLKQQIAAVTAELKERASMGSLQDMAAKLNDAEYNLATVTEQRDAYRVSLEEQHRTVDSAERELAETRKALEECSGRLTHAEWMSRVRLGALDSTRAELAKVTAELAEWKRVAAEHCDSLDIINEACEVAESSLTATRAELARSEARVKAALNHYNGQGSLCDHMREMARLLRG